jgi:N-acetyl-1-D-myo-inositol-2-amino-2-deoxy-alpha-D-glucopyranoside deacetylase
MAMSEENFRDSLRRIREAGDTTTFEGMDPEGDYPMITPDRLIDCVIDGEGYIDRKMNAMKAHATQITVDGPFFALSNNNGNQIWGSEHYRLVKGTAAPGPDGQEHDLFAGL